MDSSIALAFSVIRSATTYGQDHQGLDQPCWIRLAVVVRVYSSLGKRRWVLPVPPAPLAALHALLVTLANPGRQNEEDRIAVRVARDVPMQVVVTTRYGPWPPCHVTPMSRRAAVNQ